MAQNFVFPSQHLFHSDLKLKMPNKSITVKSLPVQEEAKPTDGNFLDTLFPLIIRPMKLFGVWPEYPIPWKRHIFVFLNLFFVHCPMLIYAIKHRDDVLEASYAVCMKDRILIIINNYLILCFLGEMTGGIIYYGRLLSFGVSAELYLEIFDDLTQAWKKGNRIDYKIYLYT